MAKAELTFSQYGADDAAFRAKCTAIHDAIVAMGLVNTADTGQINLATVLRPTALNQIAGYKMYRFNDTLQATNPVFIKILFGCPESVSANLSSGNNWGLFQLFFQVGTATDGAGNLTGLKKSAVRALTYASDSTSGSNTIAAADQANSHLISGETNRLCLVIGANSNHVPSGTNYVDTEQNVNFSPVKSSMLLIERSRNQAGAVTGDGIVVMATGNKYGNATYNLFWHYSLYIPFDRPVPAPHTVLNCVYPGDAVRTTTLNALNLSAMPIKPMEGGKEKFPPISLMSGLAADFAWNGFATPINVYGTERFYRPISAVIPISIGRQYVNSRLLILWED